MYAQTETYLSSMELNATLTAWGSEKLYPTRFDPVVRTTGPDGLESFMNSVAGSFMLIQYPLPDSKAVNSLKPGLKGSYTFHLLSIKAHTLAYFPEMGLKTDAISVLAGCLHKEIKFEPLLKVIEKVTA